MCRNDVLLLLHLVDQVIQIPAVDLDGFLQFFNPGLKILNDFFVFVQSGLQSFQFLQKPSGNQSPVKVHLFYPCLLDTCFRLVKISLVASGLSEGILHPVAGAANQLTGVSRRVFSTVLRIFQGAASACLDAQPHLVDSVSPGGCLLGGSLNRPAVLVLSFRPLRRRVPEPYCLR